MVTASVWHRNTVYTVMYLSAISNRICSQNHTDKGFVNVEPHTRWRQLPGSPQECCAQAYEDLNSCWTLPSHLYTTHTQNYYTQRKCRPGGGGGELAVQLLIYTVHATFQKWIASENLENYSKNYFLILWHFLTHLSLHLKTWSWINFFLLDRQSFLAIYASQIIIGL